jgi:hypothetical protein
MTTPRHTYGCAIVLDSAETIAWSAVVTDGVTPFNLTSADVADPTLTAGTYSPEGFLNHVAKQLRASIFARLVADAAVTVEPSAATDLDVRLGFDDADIIAGVGTSLPTLYIDADLACETANGPVTLTSITLNNTNGVWSRTGLCNVGESRTFTTSGGVAQGEARFCPRWFFCFRAARKDTGDYEELASLTSEPMGDGSAFTVEEGQPVFARDIAIVNQRQSMAGPSFVVGRFGSFGATRNILNLQTYSESLFYGMSNTYKRTTNLVAGMYLRCGGWWARFKEVSGDSLVCYDVWPTTRVPVAGEPIQVISEAHALAKEWVRTGLLFPYEPNDADGAPTWISKAYAPRVQAQGSRLPLSHNRRDNANALYTMNLNGFLVWNPGLATP